MIVRRWLKCNEERTGGSGTGATGRSAVTATLMTLPRQPKEPCSQGNWAMTSATAAVSFFAYGTCRNSLGPCALLLGPSTPQTII